MNGTSHASYSFLIFTFTSTFLLGQVPAGGPSVLAIAMGLFPDIDAVAWLLFNRGKKPDTSSFQHHLMYPTHWPVTYTPLLVWTAVAIWLGIFPMHFLAMTVGIYTHLAFDSMACGDGMNWGAPWGRRFVNLFSSKTDGYHGRYWNARFNKTVLFKLGHVAAIGALVVLVLITPSHPADLGWYIFALAGLGFVMATGLIPVPPEYAKEPPEGRYHDYRRLPEYYERLPQKKKDQIRAWHESHPRQGSADVAQKL